MKFKVFLIMLSSIIALTAGTAVSYYNTKTFGFDEDAKIVSHNEKSITVYDYTVQYDDVKRVVKTASDNVLHDSFCCTI